MRYRIEYLQNTADAESVCHVKTPLPDDLAAVTAQAHSFSLIARRLFGATGFQVREQTSAGKIVALEVF